MAAGLSPDCGTATAAIPCAWSAPVDNDSARQVKAVLYGRDCFIDRGLIVGQRRIRRRGGVVFDPERWAKVLAATKILQSSASPLWRPYSPSHSAAFAASR